MQVDPAITLPNLSFVEENGMHRMATRNLTPHNNVYGEKLITIEGTEYRMWSPHRSKLAAMIAKGMTVPLGENSRVLYLGGATGTTASHVSDIVSNGRVFVVEFSPRAMRDLVKVCTIRKNMVPIFADASRPASFRAVPGTVDLIYQDIAQPNQAEIALFNARAFLKDGGYLVMAIKARSIDSTASPTEVYKNEMDILEQEFRITAHKNLEPFHSDHMALIAVRK